MADRKGEKTGWTLGWFGGFLWVAILSFVFLFRENWIQGLIGLLLTCAAAFCIISLAPWRHPLTPYWKLMIVLYVLFMASAAWAVWSFGGLRNAGIDWWTMLWLLPLMIPFGSLSRRRWCDFDASPGGPQNAAEPRQ